MHEILPLNWLYVYNMLIYVFKVRNGRLPEPSTTDFVNYQAVRNTRQNFLYYVPSYRTKYLQNTIIVQGPKIANEYIVLFENHCSIGTFKRAAKNLLFLKLD